MNSIEIKGKYNTAHCYVDKLDETTTQQVYSFLSNPIFNKGRIALMPDCHAGKGSCIGFTTPVSDKIIPNVVGVDIGCGMLSVNLGKQGDINLLEFDNYLRDVIPLGQSVRSKSYDPIRSAKLFHTYVNNNYLAWSRKVEEIIALTSMNSSRAWTSIGTLGGGNHFIELNKNDEDEILLTIHSGSRNFGLQVATYHQNLADITCNNSRLEAEAVVRSLKGKYAGKQLGLEIGRYKSNIIKTPKDQAYLMGIQKDNYLKDLTTAQEYASLNRYIMASEIVKFFSLSLFDLTCIESVHNWIADDGIIRKGAIQANEGQLVVIPLNMRDGVIIGRGKGNPDYNYSAPHGAGRVLSRSQAKATLDMGEFENEMKNVFSTSVSVNTLDESPMAYKNADMIIEYLEPTVDIIGVYKPIYNLKA